MLNAETVRTLNRLIYPVIYEPDPLRHVDWVVRTVVNGSGVSPDQALSAVAEALASHGWVEQIASRGDHSEVALKSFLMAVGKRMSPPQD